MQKKKGEYGYRDSNRKMRLLIVLVLCAAIIIQLLFRYLTTNQAARNILTVMAILTVLPMANMASPMIASWRYRTPSETFYKKVSAYESRFPMVYDLVITSKDAIMPMDAIAIHPIGVFAYCTNPKADTEKAEQFLNSMLSGHKLKPHAKVITDENAFFRRLDNLKPEIEYEDDGTVPYVESLLKSLSM